MNCQITIENLTKYYGAYQALKGISLQIQPGMFGLLGRNGAGKTTLMRVLTALLCKTDGTITINGADISDCSAVRKMTGYLPQEFSIYPNMTVYEAMDYLGVLSGLSRDVRKERIPSLLREVNLLSKGKVKCRALSGGMKRRLGIAQALLHNPSIVIVDEPTAGLDPEERIRFRELLVRLASNKIVLLSTHIVEDVEKTCENIAILDYGRLTYCGLTKEFIAGHTGLEEAYIKHLDSLPSPLSITAGGDE